MHSMSRAALSLTALVFVGCEPTKFSAAFGDVQVEHAPCDWNATVTAVPGTEAWPLRASSSRRPGRVVVGDVLLEVDVDGGLIERPLFDDAVTQAFADDVDEAIYTWSSRKGLLRHHGTAQPTQCGWSGADVVGGAAAGQRVVVAWYDENERSGLSVSDDACASFRLLLAGSGGQLYSIWLDGEVVRGLLAYPTGETDYRAWSLGGPTLANISVGYQYYATPITGDRFVIWGSGATEYSVDGGTRELLPSNGRVDGFCPDGEHDWNAIITFSDGGIELRDARGKVQKLPLVPPVGHGACLGVQPIVEEYGKSVPMQFVAGRWKALTAAAASSRSSRDPFVVSDINCRARVLHGVTHSPLVNTGWTGDDTGWWREGEAFSERAVSADGVSATVRTTVRGCFVTEIEAQAGERFDIPGPCIATGLHEPPVPQIHNLTHGLGFHLFAVDNRDSTRCVLVTADTERLDVRDCLPADQSVPRFVQRDPRRARTWIAYSADRTSLTENGGETWLELQPNRQYLFGPRGALHRLDRPPQRAIGLAAKADSVSWVLVDGQEGTIEVAHVRDSVELESLDGQLLGVQGSSLVYKHNQTRQTHVVSY